MFADMPKVELHLHLDGALPPRTLLQLAERYRAFDLLPGENEEAIAGWFIFRDFDHFVEVVRVIKRLLRSAEDFALAVSAAGAALAAQNVRYAEITVTPYSLIDALKHGATLESMLEGLETGRRQVREAYGLELRWIFDIPRNRAFADYRLGGPYVPGAAERTLEYALAGRDYGVVGLGLGGSEVNAPPEPFAHVFEKARAEGLRSVPHAGESAGPASIWGAVEALKADRIGHGIRAVEDARLLATLAERQIPLEVCMSCNVALSFTPQLSDHPLPLLDAAGVLVTINTDDPMLVGATLSQEYAHLVEVFGWPIDDVLRLARNSFTASFAEPELKARLLAEFDAWRAARGV